MGDVGLEVVWLFMSAEAITTEDSLLRYGFRVVLQMFNQNHKPVHIFVNHVVVVVNARM